MKKILTVAALASAAIGLPLMSAGAAMADDSSDSLVTVGEGSCVAPWYWEGPITALNGPEQYSACNGPKEAVKPGDLAGALDNSCILPWHWEGPGTAGDGVLGGILTGVADQPSTYAACNTGS